MELTLTKNQLKKLIEYVYIGHYIVSGNKDLKGEGWEEDDEFEDYIVEFAAKNGFEDLFDKHEDKFYHSEDFCDKIQEEIEEFEDESTWSNIENWLARRDISLKYSKEELHNMDSEEYFELVMRYIHKYQQEFEKNGVSNLYIKE